MMSRKHYRAIAQTISDCGGPYEDVRIGRAVNDIRNFIAKDLAKFFEQENPNFDYRKFIEACNLER